jgi:hypothetical protein
MIMFEIMFLVFAVIALLRLPKGRAPHARTQAKCITGGAGASNVRPRGQSRATVDTT